MPKYSINNIISKTLDGIQTAHSEYKKWSNGYWITEGPEYLMTTAIARTIAEIPGLSALGHDGAWHTAYIERGGRT